MAAGKFRDYVATLPRKWEPGSICQYNSCDTSVLAFLVQEVSGKSLTDYMQEKLCEPLGMEYPGYWIVDPAGDELAAGGLNLTARDFARLGELYRNAGLWNGKQIVPREYVQASVKVNAPQCAPGKPVVGNHTLPVGYGYQWWLPVSKTGDFSAIGVYNQYIYVDPARHIVIVKSSANPRYGLSADDSDNKDLENISALQAISAALA